MKTKDILIVALVPPALLLIPLAGQFAVEGWNWTLSDFVVAWVVFTGTVGFYRLLVTRRSGNLAYRAGAGLAVAAGFLITWINLAVQIIGDENPGNLLYFLVILGGFLGVGLSRFESAALAKVAFAMAGTLVLIPVIAVFAWPADFNPGFPQVLILSAGFATMFAGSGLLFRHAASQPRGTAAGETA